VGFDVGTKFVVAAGMTGEAAVLAGANSISAAFGALGGQLAKFGLSVAGLYKLIDLAVDTVRAASALDDLSDATGSTVENLSRLANQAKIAGAPFETLESLMLRLSAGMAGTDEQSERVQRAMAALGVSARDPAQALNEIAVKLSEFGDGIEKAAIARELFGRSGPAFLATLKDIAEAQDVVATVTRQQAADAERLEKEWRRLGIEGQALANTLLSTIVPALATQIEGFRLARNAGLSWWQAADFGTVSAEGLPGRIGIVTRKMAEYEAQIDGMRVKAKDDPIFGIYAQEQIDRTAGKIAEASKQLSVLIALRDKAIMRNVEAMGDTGDQTDRLLAGLNRRAGDARLAEIVGQLGGGGKAKATVDEFIRMLDQVKRSAAEVDAELTSAFSGEQIVAAEKELAKLMASDDWKKLSEGQQITLMVEYDSVIEGQKELVRIKKATEDVNKATLELAATKAKAAAINQREIDDLIKQNESLEGRLAQLKREGEEIGLTNDQLRALTISRIDDEIRQKEQTLATYENIEGMETQAALMRSQIALLNQIRDQTASNQTAQGIADQAKKASDEWARAAQSIEQSLTDALLRGFESGADFAANLRDTLVNMFKTLVLRPIIQAVLAPVAGGLGSLLPGSAGASPLGGGGGGGLDLLSTLFSGAGSLFGGGTLFGGSLAGGGIFSSGLGATFATSALGEGLGLTVAMGAGEGMALTALGSMLGTAIPVIGAVLAIAALAGAFDKDPSQVQGRFGIRPGESGFEDNAFTKSPFGNLGFLDDGTKYFSGEAAQVFNTLVGDTLAAFSSRMDTSQIESLADKLQGMDFGSFEGEYTTQEFIEKYGGQILQQVISTAFGELDPALQAVFDGFKGTADEAAEFANVLLAVHDLTKTIPTDLRETLIAALDGTAETSEQVIAFAGAYLTLQEVMNRDPLEDALTAIADASDSAYVSLMQQADAFEELIEAYDGSAAASEEIAQATVDYYNALVNVIAGIRQLRASIGEMFDRTIEEMMLETMSDDGKKDYFANQIDLLAAQLETATDPAEIERLTSQINEYIRASFGLLTPDEQVRMLDQYTAYAREIAALADERLAAAEEAAQARADALLTQLRSVLETAANDMRSAGADMKLAATTLLAAARTPITVVLETDDVVDR
jgi:hypothetical protein